MSGAGPGPSGRGTSGGGGPMVMDQVHQQISDDWENREYVEQITTSVKKMCAFLNEFDMTCRHKLACLREKLTMLERRLDYLEARLSHTSENSFEQREVNNQAQ